MKKIRKRCLAAILTMVIVLSGIMIPNFRSEASGGLIQMVKETVESSVYDKTYVYFLYVPSDSDTKIVATITAPNGQTKTTTLDTRGQADVGSVWATIVIAGTYSISVQEKVRNSSGEYVDSGVFATARVVVSGKKSGWAKTNGKWCYYNTSGVRQYGWQQIGGKWYFLDKLWGAMYTGWQEIENKWYFFNNSGAAAVGWKKISGKWYYFNKNCSMATGWKEIDKKWYYFNSKGAMLNKWQQISGKWYYFMSGAMVKGWKHIDGKWYYFQKNGAMVANKTIKIDGKPYTFDKSGAWVSKAGSGGSSSNNSTSVSKSTGSKVWVAGSGNGSKYHSSPDCSNMTNPIEITLEAAKNKGYTPCTKCH